jgi:predicted MFS family arabinose efflux permease
MPSAPPRAPLPRSLPLPRAFTPLRHRAFRALWLAALASNIGLWIQSAAAGWMMTMLDPRPLMVSLVQVAAMLPVFLLALPGGAVADIVDRRRFLIGVQGWVLGMGLLLALLTALDAVGPWGLLFFTFLIGAGSALTWPAWSATTPELVPREDLVSAIALNGISFNLARAVGPAIGGLALGLAGPEAAFALNAATFLVLILALIAWQREPGAASRLPKEHLLSAMRAGLRFVSASPAMHAAIIRACVFFFFAAAIWGLFPLLVRDRLGLGPEAFGLLLGVVGVGAVAAGFLLPWLRAKLDRGAMVFWASLLAAAAMGALAVATHWLPAVVALAVYGGAWIAAGSTLSAAAQLAAPAWVRARAIAIHQLSFFGCMAVGSAMAGWLGDWIGVGPTLAALAAGAAVAAVAVRRWRLDLPTPPAAMPANPLPRPGAPAAALSELLAEDSGRVLQVVRYRIDPARRDAFLAVMREVRGVRLRGGASQWRLYEDVADPDRWVELWAVESWHEHLREQARLSEADRGVLARAAALHAGDEPAEAARFLNVQP